MSVSKLVFRDPEATAEASAKHILELATQALAHKATASLAVSGGTTPKLLFTHMVQLPFDWRRLHLFFVDERAVPPTDELSNFKLAKENLIDPAGIPESQVHRIHGELPPEQAAADYARGIQDFFGIPETGTPRFDIVHEGTGPDAHTASLFPGDALIENTDGIAAATFSQSKGNWRITLLPKVLLAAANTIFLVTGEDKASAVQQVLEGNYDPKQFPAQLVSRGAYHVEWFLDEPAAALLRKS